MLNDLRRQQGGAILQIIIAMELAVIMVASLIIAAPTALTYTHQIQANEIRTAAASALDAIKPLKQSISEHYILHGEMPIDATAAGLLPAGHYASETVSAVMYERIDSASGLVIAKYRRADMPEAIADETLILEAVGTNTGVSWRCSEYSTVPDEYSPC